MTLEKDLRCRVVAPCRWGRDFRRVNDPGPLVHEETIKKQGIVYTSTRVIDVPALCWITSARETRLVAGVRVSLVSWCTRDPVSLGPCV